MPYKNKKKQTKKTNKRKTQIRKSNKRKPNKRKTYKMRGGNYERDITTRTTEGVATKPLNKFVVTVPGYGTMSAAAYKNLMERIDRDGGDDYIY
jgi:hypothetical protein